MIVGLDFDNTLACYDDVFCQVARERGWLEEPAQLSKHEVRQHFRQLGREEIWTELQGEVYGPAILRASPFPGLPECLTQLARHGFSWRVISHKTAAPYLGLAHDLHAWARRWLEHWQMLQPHGPISPEQVFFCSTRQEKLQRIGQEGCGAFVDDLPEVFAEPGFPSGVKKLLFDPAGHHGTLPDLVNMRSWSELGSCLRA
jgi:hypothetical protein